MAYLKSDLLMVRLETVNFLKSQQAYCNVEEV
jgi:hypothetical protein